MKILSLILFVAAMVWTWNLTHRMDSVPYSSHQGLQAEIAVVIEEAVRKAHTNLESFIIEKVWTENLDDGRVRAEYTYTFVEADGLGASQTISGELFLKRMNENSAQETWQLEKAQTTNESLTFAEGIVVRPGDTGPAAEEEPALPEESEDTEIEEDINLEVEQSY